MRPTPIPVCVLSLLAVSCGGSNDGSGGGSSPPTSQQTFMVDTISVIDGAIWQINRPIDIAFNRDIDFSTVLTPDEVRDSHG